MKVIRRERVPGKDYPKKTLIEWDKWYILVDRSTGKYWSGRPIHSRRLSSELDDALIFSGNDLIGMYQYWHWFYSVDVTEEVLGPEEFAENPYRRNVMRTSGKRPISTKAISIRPISIGHINDVAELLNLPTSGDAQENWWEYISTVSYEAISQADEEDIEEAGGEDKYREEIEERIEKELYGHYENAIEFVFEQILTDVNAYFEVWGNDYKIIPEKSWKDVAREIVEILTGYGTVYGGQDVEEFLEISSATSYRDLVKTHLHWLKLRPEVYGGPSLERMYYSQMESVRL